MSNINMYDMVDILKDDIDNHDIISVYAKLLVEYKWKQTVISEFISLILQDSEDDCQLCIDNMIKWDFPENSSVSPLENVTIPYEININYTPNCSLFRWSILKKSVTIDATRLCNSLFDHSTISEDLIIKEGCTEIGERALNLTPNSRCRVFIPKSVRSIAISALPKYSRDVEIYFAGTRKQFTEALYNKTQNKMLYWKGSVKCSDGVWKNTSTKPLRL